MDSPGRSCSRRKKSSQICATNLASEDLPWVAVNKDYLFEGSNGKQALSELFDGRSQLIVYHFMFDPVWEEACLHCSFWADNFNGIIVHLNQRDVTMIAVSGAPYSKLAAYRKRMGWNFKWVSSWNTDFNFDHHVSFSAEELVNKEAFYNFITQDPHSSEREGVSVFLQSLNVACFTPIQLRRVGSIC